MTDETLVPSYVGAASYDGRNIEELIGFVEDTWDCRYMGVSGTLFAGTDGIAFIGQFFLFDKKLHLKWVDIKVQHTEQGISIQTRDKNEHVVHDFNGIHKPERCWSTLVSLHNQALLDRTRSPSPDGTTTTALTTSATGRIEGEGEADAAAEAATARPRSATVQPIHRRKQLRRNTSDPNKLAPAIDALFAAASFSGEDLSVDKDDNIANETQDEATEAPTTSRRLSSLLGPTRASIILNSPSSTQQHQKTTDDALKSNLSERSNMGVLEINPSLEIEAIVGKIQGRFSCLYNGQQGNLYAGSTALYFAGGRLFFPARLSIQSTHIRQVKMIKGKPKSDLPVTSPSSYKEQGIAIFTREGASHTFLGMENPDQVWASLVALRKHVSDAPNAPRPFAMRRMNSDPNLQSQRGDDLLSPSICMDVVGGKGQAEEQQELALSVLSDEELKAAWSEVMAKKNRYTSCVVKDQKFACGLDQFFKNFIADDAPFAVFGTYMTDQGDKEVKASPWKPTKQNGKLVRSRVVRYVHPINAPMAPPEAKARKEQTYQRVGDYGFIVETNTFVDDVPMTDCFFVKDRVLVAAVSSGAQDGQEKGNGHVLLTLEFELEFVKSTMFRGIITRTTSKEMSDYFVQMKVYMIKSLGSTSGAGEDDAAKEAEDKSAERDVVIDEPFVFPGARGFLSSLYKSALTNPLLVSVIMMQFWILMEMYSMKYAIRRIENMECYSKPPYAGIPDF